MYKWRYKIPCNILLALILTIQSNPIDNLITDIIPVPRNIPKLHNIQSNLSMISIEKREISNTFTHLPIYNISFVLSVFQVSPIFQFLMIFGVNSTFTFYLRFHRAAMTFPSSRSLKSLRRSLGAIDWTLVVKRVTRVLHRKIGPYDSREGHRLKGRLATDA